MANISITTRLNCTPSDSLSEGWINHNHNLHLSFSTEPLRRNRLGSRMFFCLYPWIGQNSKLQSMTINRNNSKCVQSLLFLRSVLGRIWGLQGGGFGEDFRQNPEGCSLKALLQGRYYNTAQNIRWRNSLLKNVERFLVTVFSLTPGKKKQNKI